MVLASRPILQVSSDSLPAEGRLKGNDISSLVSLRRPRAGSDQPVSHVIFSKMTARTACWTDPVRLLGTFLDLARIHSPSADESPVADYLKHRLDQLGFETTRDPVGNLIVTLPASGDFNPNLPYTAHMDCAYPRDSPPGEPVLHSSGDIGTDGRNSLGADDKSGIAGILATLEFIIHARIPHGDLKVVFTVQEEIGWRGIKQVPASILNGVHLVTAMDPPVRVERDETGFKALLNVSRDHVNVELARSCCRLVGGSLLLPYSDDGCVGGDTICISPIGANVIDFCSGSRYVHTTHDHLRFEDLARQTSWMIAVTKEVLKSDSRETKAKDMNG